MKKIIISSVFVLIGLIGPASVHADIQFRQSTSTPAAINVSQKTTTYTTTKGDFLVVGINSFTTGRTITVGDSQGNTYTLATSSTGSVGPVTTWVYYLPNIPGGNLITSSTVSGAAASSRIFVHEYSGVAKVNPLDTFTSSSTPSLNNLSNTGLMPTQGKKELFFLFNSHTTAPTPTFLNGFRSREVTSLARGSTGDQIVASSSITGFTFFSATAGWDTIMVAFLPELPRISIWSNVSFWGRLSIW